MKSISRIGWLIIFVLAGCKDQSQKPLSPSIAEDPSFTNEHLAIVVENDSLYAEKGDSIFTTHSTLKSDNPSANFHAFAKKFRTVEIDSVTYYITEGDLLCDIDQLYGYFLFSRNAADQTFRENSAKLIGAVYNGQLSRWPLNTPIRYCVQRNSFGTTANYQLVVGNMQQATADWESACNVDFEYVPAADNSPTGTIPPQVDFIVREVDAHGEFIASAFFPHYPLSERRMLLDPTYYTSRFNMVGVLRHELGHVMGFRHEHIRSGAPPRCPDDDTAEPFIEVTNYDPQSVMHYFCGSVGTMELNLTDVDRRGASLIYGSPVNRP